MNKERVLIASRGSALALAQTHLVLREASSHFPQTTFEVRIVKTTGDKLPTPELTRLAQTSKGLFTKELEVALLDRIADLAIHSLKDLPTELPEGLLIGAVPPRGDPRDVLVYRQEFAPVASGNDGEGAKAILETFPAAMAIGTSSLRRQCELVALVPGLKTLAVRGNVGSRLRKLVQHSEIGALVLAAAGLARLNYSVKTDGTLQGDGVPEGLKVAYFSTEEMIPCVGQGALAIETRADDGEMRLICERLNCANSLASTTAERAFLRAMGGGCLSPVAAYARVRDNLLEMDAVFFREQEVVRARGCGPVLEAEAVGERLAGELKSRGNLSWG